MPSLPGEFMQSIMSREIAYSFRHSDFGIDRTTKSDDSLFRLPAISQFCNAPDDLLFICPLSQGSFIPPENPNVWDALAFQLKETSLLKSAHTISFALSISSSVRDLPIRHAFCLVAGKALVINYCAVFRRMGGRRTKPGSRRSTAKSSLVREVVSLDRKCLGSISRASASCPEALPIKANDFSYTGMGRGLVESGTSRVPA